MPDDLKEKMAVVRELTELSKFERMVYLGVTILSLVMLVGSALSLMINNKAGSAELTMLLGSSGLITYSTGRLLFMWNEALKRLMLSIEKVAYPLSSQIILTPLILGFNQRSALVCFPKEIQSRF